MDRGEGLSENQPRCINRVKGFAGRGCDARDCEPRPSLCHLGVRHRHDLRLMKRSRYLNGSPLQRRHERNEDRIQAATGGNRVGVPFKDGYLGQVCEFHFKSSRPLRVHLDHVQVDLVCHCGLTFGRLSLWMRTPRPSVAARCTGEVSTRSVGAIARITVVNEPPPAVC